MRFITLHLWGVGLAGCACLVLAGCAADPITEPDLLGNWPPFEGPSKIGDLPTGPRTPNVPLRDYSEKSPAAQLVQRAQFDSSSTDGRTTPSPPPPATGDTPDKPITTDTEPALQPLPPLPGAAAPRRIDGAIPWDAPDPEPPAYPVELTMSTALGMVAGRNPIVAFAAQQYREAYAQLESARALWLPSIRAGVSYNKHEGTLQPSNGKVIAISRASLNSGLGVQGVGTGSPEVTGVVASFHLTDAVFQPRIANRVAAAAQEASRATTNDVLLDTALGYLRLLEATEQKAIAEETLDNTQNLADLTATFAESGQGSQADADRAKAELVVRKNRVVRADEEIEVASARLNELLRMDPMTTLVSQEPTVVPIELVAREIPIRELLATGLSTRPELEESRHLVGEAVHRYRREKYAPLLPSAFLGASYTGFGGGTGSSIVDFGDRFDFDAVVYWELRNLGFGERAAREEARSKYQQARLRRIQIMDRVAREIIEAHAQVRARDKQIATAESGIEAATDSYRRNNERIRAGEGLPIEVLQAVQALDQARREYLRIVVDYNEAQFRLHRALGWPIQ